jgi:hypothetical protein
MSQAQEGVRPARWVLVGIVLVGLLAGGSSSGCRKNPNAFTAETQRQWEQGPPATPPPQAGEAMRRLQQEQARKMQQQQQPVAPGR